LTWPKSEERRGRETADSKYEPRFLTQLLVGSIPWIRVIDFVDTTPVCVVQRDDVGRGRSKEGITVGRRN
jgi:hypothetical protein